MAWKLSSHRADNSPLHSPSPISHRLPKTVHRTLKYALLILFILACIYTLAVIDLDLPTSQPPILSTNHASPFHFANHTFPLPPPTIGKVTASFGPRTPIYDSAISSHSQHNARFDYPHFILREQMLPGLWTKHACLLTVIGAELAKSEEERLKWLFWHDRDVVLMNENVPLEAFLPPEDDRFRDVQLLVTRDRNGLNNGVFFVRVSAWSMKMLASALSVREYERGVELRYTEQSGMERVISRPWWSPQVAYVPQRWFNAYAPPAILQHSSKYTNPDSFARPGSLLIHFASNRSDKPERMTYWSEAARKKDPSWHRSYNETGYVGEIKEYWERVGRGESMEEICRDIGRRSWD